MVNKIAKEGVFMGVLVVTVLLGALSCSTSVMVLNTCGNLAQARWISSVLLP